MQHLQWDPISYSIGGERTFLISGEFHYFRVPASDWETRLKLFKEAGGNCVATYIPWILHEPTEGDIRFGDTPQRDLEGFLNLCARLDIMVVCRPGPYEYSEMRFGGLPEWLCEGYPEILARNIKNEIFSGMSVSYLHPLFLEKAKKWFDVVCPLLARFTQNNGGPVVMVQIDNELMGVHEWQGTWDYNADTMGFGKADGRFPRFLEERYRTVENLNAAYGSRYDAFSSVYPNADHPMNNVQKKRREKDYQEFYFETIAEYVEILYRWMREAGIDCQIVHNSANPYMNSYFLETVERLKGDLLLGSDHYYNLGQGWNQNNPTPQYAVNVFYSCEQLRLMGYPPTIFEMPGGSSADWPPVLPEDLMCCYLLNVAFGTKGINYYIFTGGPNPEGICNLSNIYDYGAPVSATGEIRPTYETMKQFHAFLHQHPWLSATERATDFYAGMDWWQSRCKHYDTVTEGDYFAGGNAWEFFRKGILTTSLCGSLSASFADLTNLEDLDISKPLFVAASTRMAENMQQQIIRFVSRGGRVLIAPVIPHLNENFEPCTLLSDFLSCGCSHRCGKSEPMLRIGPVDNVMCNGNVWVNDFVPHDAVPLAWETGSNTVIGWEKKCGENGSVIWLGMNWEHAKFEHTEMIKYFLQTLGGSTPFVSCSNENVFTALRLCDDKAMLFVMNLLSCPLEADVQVNLSGETKFTRRCIHLHPMEIKTFPVDL